MKKFLKFLLVFVITALLGTLSHFVYDWTNQCIYIAFLFPVNESLFEHLKMFFFPVMIVSLIQSFKVRKKGIFLASRVYGVIFSMIGCIAFYYIYNSISDNPNDLIYIISYYVLLFLGLFISYNIYLYMQTLPEYLKWIAYGLALYCVLIFIFFTYQPMNNQLFIEPK